MAATATAMGVAAGARLRGQPAARETGHCDVALAARSQRKRHLADGQVGVGDLGIVAPVVRAGTDEPLNPSVCHEVRAYEGGARQCSPHHFPGVFTGHLRGDHPISRAMSARDLPVDRAHHVRRRLVGMQLGGENATDLVALTRGE